MKLLRRLRPKVKHHNDFYVFDTETKVSYSEWVLQRTNENKKFNPPPKKPGIYFGLSARPESFCFGVIYGLNYTKVFHSREEMILELRHERFKDKKVFAHNATYDLTTLYGNIFHMDSEAIFNGSRFIMATNGVCTFADSLNLMQTSVKKIGELLGIKKPELGEDYYADSIDANVINRCVMDCQIVWEGLVQLFEEAGDIRVTQASLSMTYFRRFHQKFDIEHNEYLGKVFWDSYFGGRCEAFKLGNVHGKVIDVNSMYPYAMKVAKFPNPKFLRVESKPTPARFEEILFNKEGAARVDVVHKENWAGYLPVKHDGKLLFPIGKFSGTWNLNELRHAISTGMVSVTHCKEIFFSEPMVSPFDNYVDHLYSRRLTSKNEFEKYRIKIFMNSLYGKFAQRIDCESIYIPDVNKAGAILDEYDKKGLVVELQMFNAKRVDAQLIIKSSKFANLSYSIPAFSSYITSFARVHLLKKMESLKSKGVLYCDTDSVFISNDFGIKDEHELGGWKLEPKIVTCIRGLKNYQYTDTITGKVHNRIKGIPEKAIQIATNSYEYYNMLKTREAMRQDKTPGVLTRRVKILSGDYSKRIVYSNGETKPIIL